MTLYGQKLEFEKHKAIKKNPIMSGVLCLFKNNNLVCMFPTNNIVVELWRNIVYPNIDFDSWNYIKTDDPVKLHLEIVKKRIELKERVKTKQSSNIYIISNSNGAYKIGVSKSPTKRLKNLQTSTSEALVLIFSCLISDAYRHEKYLHKLFANKNIKGEWFKLNSIEVKSAIKYLEGLI